MQLQTHQQFALESKTIFLLHDLDGEPMQGPVDHERLCVSVPKRPKAFGRDPQTRAAPKGSEQRCLKIFLLPTKPPAHETTIDRHCSQQRSCQSLLHAPQGIPKRFAALLWSQESVSAELSDPAASVLQRESQPPESVGEQTLVWTAETIRLLHSRLL